MSAAEPMSWLTLALSLALAVWPLWLILAACLVLAWANPPTCGARYGDSPLTCGRHPKHGGAHVGDHDGETWAWVNFG